MVVAALRRWFCGRPAEPARSVTWTGDNLPEVEAWAARWLPWVTVTLSGGLLTVSDGWDTVAIARGFVLRVRL